MSKRVVLRCDGSLEQGFRVILEISDRNTPVFTEAIGSLPAAPDLLDQLTQWQQHYRQSLGVTRISLESISVQTGKLSEIQDCRTVSNTLQTRLKQWLASPEFQLIEQRLRETLATQDSIEILLRTNDAQLYRLPWHVWDFIERYPQTEVLLSSSPERVNLPERTHDRVRILAILGDRQGIDTEADRQLLEALPNADVTFLVEPSRQQVYRDLWDQAWDILFFAGHSTTEQQHGRLYLNPSESLTLEELRYGLRRAIAKGLQLAVFNSCDGLGLAYELEQLHIPQLIVMREPVPDRVAQEFLKQLLQAFSGGESLHYSVRQAREFLQGLEGEFPCASWLPVMFQNPAVLPLTWQNLQQVKPIPKVRSTKGRSFRWALAASIGITSLIMGGRHLGLLQAWELSAFDQLMRLRPAEKPDSRFLIVTVTEDDVRSQLKDPEPRRGSLSDSSLAKLIQKLAAYQPVAIGLDIYRDYPVSKPYAALAKQMKNSDRILGVCKVSEEGGDPGVAAPPEIDVDRQGFSDILLDSDQIVRRHYLALTPSPASPCMASYALSVQLALRYLATRGISLEFKDNETWKLGQLELAPLEAHTGGYQQLDSRGHQILMNYRSTPTLLDIAPRITLSQVLAGKLSAELVKGRIVLIGTTAESFHDRALTPYKTPDGNIQSIPGVVLQTQMTSQLISAALDGRRMLRSWSLGGELLWVWSWAVLGAIDGFVFRRPVQLAFAGGAAIALLFGSCLALLNIGIWVPFVPAGIALIVSGSISAFAVHQNKIES
ncbi:CHASE2 domain-containing protein [Cyanobacteria bacterium FACHB-63]|nr:CHASE2 domain-containing protein [Cyanobacteria bacterium FACHB-63]